MQKCKKSYKVTSLWVQGVIRNERIQFILYRCGSWGTARTSGVYKVSFPSLPQYHPSLVWRHQSPCLLNSPSSQSWLTREKDTVTTGRTFSSLFPVCTLSFQLDLWPLEDKYHDLGLPNCSGAGHCDGWTQRYFINTQLIGQGAERRTSFYLSLTILD